MTAKEAIVMLSECQAHVANALGKMAEANYDYAALLCEVAAWKLRSIQRIYNESASKREQQSSDKNQRLEICEDKRPMKTDWEKWLADARAIAKEKGLAALYSPHAATGKMCRCGGCFCCAAYAVWLEMMRETKGQL